MSCAQLLSSQMGGPMRQSRHDQIAALAYQIWEEEGRPENKAMEHWLRAEQALCGEKADKHATKPALIAAGSRPRSAAEPDQQPTAPGPAKPEDASQSRERGGRGGHCGGGKMRGKGRHRPRSE